MPMGYREQQYERLSDLDVELRDLDASRSDRAFIERLPAPGTPAPVQTSAELNAQRTKDWEIWLRARLDAERNAVLDAVAESLLALDERLTALEHKQQQRGVDDDAELPRDVIRKNPQRCRLIECPPVDVLTSGDYPPFRIEMSCSGSKRGGGFFS